MSNAEKYNNLRTEFLKVCTRVCKEDLTTNRNKHIEYLTELVRTYNDIITYVSTFYQTLDTETKKLFRDDWIYIRDKVNAVYGKLNVTSELPRQIFVLLSIGPILENYNHNATPEPSTSQTNNLIPPTGGRTKSQDTELIPKPPSSEKSLPERTDNMAATIEQKMEFIRAASQMINRSYAGDPLALASFVNSIRLLKAVTAANLNDVLLEFVKTRLEGRALEWIPPNPADVDEIITALERGIHPDNSKVVAGRLLALRVDKSKLVEFTEQAEKLADALRRSLIIEGISQAKASEMCIEKTVEVCRNAARSDLVKSVLASSKFESPKEVVAKYVVESSTEEKEKQVLAYRTFQRQNRHNGKNNGGGRGHNGKFRGRNGRNGNNGNNDRRFSRNNNNNGNYSNDGQNGNRNYDNRGNRNRNNYNDYGGNRNNNNRNNNTRGVRYSENYEAPQVPVGEIPNQN